jgi:hypothetical protein
MPWLETLDSVDRFWNWPSVWGKAEGCTCYHLDVSAESKGVEFYNRVGMRVLLRSEIPALPGHAHYRMVREFGEPS